MFILRWAVFALIAIVGVASGLVVLDLVRSPTCTGLPGTGTVIQAPGERMEVVSEALDEDAALWLDVVRKPSRGETRVLNPAHGHIHPYQEERFEIIEGRARFLIGDEQIDLSPGDVGVVPPDTVHHWEALDGKPVRAKASFTPGLRTGAWFVHFQKHLADRNMDLFQAAVISSEYGRGSPVPAEPPTLVWNVLVRVVAPIGRTLGYKAC